MTTATLAAKVRHHAADLRRCAPILRAQGLGATADEIEKSARELEEALCLPLGEPYAWESTTPAYTRFMTDSRYRKLDRRFQSWYRPIVPTPTPVRLLEIARETNLREHLHGVPPSQARPLLARFFEAAVRDAVGIEADEDKAGKPAAMVALPVRDTMKASA